MRYINAGRIIAAQLTTPEENPLLTEESCLLDIWLEGPVVRKQLFKKVTKAEQEAFVAEVTKRGFLRSGNLFVDPRGILFAEMESQILGGTITIGLQENGKPCELKVNSKAFEEIYANLIGR